MGWVNEAQGVESHLPGSSLPAAQNVTVDEIIGAYKQACQKLNCRQIPKLLRQLQVCQVTGGGVVPGVKLPSLCPPAPSGPVVPAPSKRGYTKHSPSPA